jgi:hypothetical protein
MNIEIFERKREFVLMHFWRDGDGFMSQAKVFAEDFHNDSTPYWQCCEYLEGMSDQEIKDAFEICILPDLKSYQIEIIKE